MNNASRVRQVISVAASCAIIAAAVEVVGLAIRQQILGRIVFVSHDFAWMTPLANLLIVLPAVLLVDFLFRFAGRPLHLTTLTGVLAAVLVFSLLVPYSVIAWWASAVLAAGAGLQVKRVALRADPAAWVSRLRRIATIAAIPLVLAGVGVRVAEAYAGKRTIASLPAPPQNAPNVLLLVMDTVRSRNLDLYGYGRPTTPALRRLAETSTVFDFAFSTSSWTLPSHASLFTGQPAGALVGADWIRPLAPSHRVIAETFRDHGYATGGFAANLNYTSYESGLTRGFARYADYQFSWPLLFLHSGLTRIDVKSKLPQARSLSAGWNSLIHSQIVPRTFITADVFKSADDIAREFLNWQARVGERPFFAFLNFFDAHEPYRPAGAFRRFARNDRDSVGRYDEAIASIDDVIGRMIDVLQQRGVLDHTVVVVTSDHGEAFGEHGLNTHGNTLYVETLRVPLLVRFPGVVPAARRVGTAVSLADVPSTLLDLAHLKDPAIAGRSLSELWSFEAQPEEREISAHLTKGVNVSERNRNAEGPMSSWMDTRFHYIRNSDGTEELYDYRADPDETKNIAADPARQADLVRLRAKVPR